MSRADLIEGFLDEAGWARAERRPLPADASFRRYVRLVDGARRALLMDSPPPMEDVRPWLTIGRHLRQLGLATPAVMAADEAAGFLLIEDFGEDTYSRLIAGGSAEAPLYALAIDVLIALHRNPGASRVDLPPYDEERFLEETFLLTDWYLPAVRGEPTSPVQRAGYAAAWRDALAGALTGAKTLVLRDYHVDNLMLLAGRDGIGRCGLLDFQDALIGPPAYDLVSLLQDARRDLPPGLAEEMRQRYVAAMPGLDAAAHDRAYAVLGAQRHAKVIGIFTRLARRDGKPMYLSHIPRVWRLLERCLREPVLAPVRAWFDANVPPGMRRIPALSEAI